MSAMAHGAHFARVAASEQCRGKTFLSSPTIGCIPWVSSSVVLFVSTTIADFSCASFGGPQRRRE